MNKYLIGLIAILAVAIAILFGQYQTQKEKAERQTQNMENITKDNAVLSLTVSEYGKIHTRDTEKLDSVLKANKIKPRQLKGATIINIQYRDTGSTKIVYKDAIRLPDNSYKIPAGFDSQCWGFKGEILSKDPGSTLNITEKKASPSAQLVVVKEKRFLFWVTKKSEYKAFSDCGSITFTDIKFVKK